MNILTIAVKKEYFEAIRASEKLFEYRVMKEYWKKRLEGREYKEVHITLGYPPKEDLSRRMQFRWKGFKVQEIQHKEFGELPVNVYAIDLSERI